jgi:hypothetical protein
VVAGNTSTPVQIAWTAATDKDQFNNVRPIFGYQVERRTTALGAATTFNPSPVTALTFTDTTANSNTTYFYTVVAIDQAGLRTSSAQGSVLTHSSFHNDIVGFFDDALDGNATCVSCHAFAVPEPNLTGTDAQIHAQLATRVNTATPELGLFPCRPSLTCVPPLAHSGGDALVKPTGTPADNAGNAQRRNAYLQIIKWISEGAANN